MSKPHILRRGSISLRLALVFSLLMISVLIGGASLVYVDVRSALDQSINDRLKLRWKDLAEFRSSAHDPQATQARNLLTKTDGSAQAYSADGVLLATTPSVTDIRLADPRQVRQRAKRTGSVRQHDERRDNQFAVYGGTPYPGAPVILVGADLRVRNDALDDLLHELIIGAAIVTVLSTAVAYAISRGALAPVEQLRLQAEALSASGGRTVLDVPSTDDEIARLATTLNQLLAQLYGTVQRERRFVADAGHELRTPLAIAQGEIELLIDVADRTPEDAEALETALGELRYLATLGERLLDIGGISHAPMHLDELKVSRLTERTVERQGSLDASRANQIDVRIDDDVSFTVDQQLAEVALMNLVDNAFRYGSAPVTIHVAATRDEVRFTVSDTGAGFPAEYAASAFEPFSRVDQARTTRGAGIGLAIVNDIMEAHGGRASISDQDPTAVVLTFPRAPALRATAD